MVSDFCCCLEAKTSNSAKRRKISKNKNCSPFFRPSVCLSFCICVCLSIYLFVDIYVCLFCMSQNSFFSLYIGCFASNCLLKTKLFENLASLASMFFYPSKNTTLCKQLLINETSNFKIINRPGVAGAVLQSPPSLIN